MISSKLRQITQCSSIPCSVTSSILRQRQDRSRPCPSRHRRDRNLNLALDSSKLPTASEIAQRFWSRRHWNTKLYRGRKLWAPRLKHRVESLWKTFQVVTNCSSSNSRSRLRSKIATLRPWSTSNWEGAPLVKIRLSPFSRATTLVNAWVPQSPAAYSQTNLVPLTSSTHRSRTLQPRRIIALILGPAAKRFNSRRPSIAAWCMKGVPSGRKVGWQRRIRVRRVMDTMRYLAIVITIYRPSW